MAKLFRTALALPVALAMATPAAANLFWDFSTTWSAGSDTYTLSGQTEAGTGSPGIYNLNNISFSINESDAGFVPYTGGGFTIGGGGTFNPDYRTSPDVQVQFFGPDNAQFAQSFTWTTNGWDPDGGAQAYTLTSNGQTFYLNGQAENDGEFFPSNRTEDGATSFSVTQQVRAEAVPEINGSGFAYIAFILGALGLWLYSGGARGRTEELPATA